MDNYNTLKSDYFSPINDFNFRGSYDNSEKYIDLRNPLCPKDNYSLS
ncbi:MAG: hypothetical protein WC979_06250 [Candidatus Pacearchaeota archaeon]|jgi:hypothetical protein